MELLSTWIAWICLILCIQFGNGLQGVPTWISLGLKSPFIEFKAEAEILSNVSVSLNASTTAGLKENKNGIQNLGPFTYPMEQYNDSGSNINQNSPVRNGQTIQRKQHVIRVKNKDLHFATSPTRITENPFVFADMNSKKEATIIDLKTTDDSQDDEADRPEQHQSDRSTDRKYIIPLALKNPTPEPRKSPLFQDPKTNIDDLKRHILMLQNLTKSDQNFQSKFVVFPNLQRNASESITPATITTSTTVSTVQARPSSMRISSSFSASRADTNAVKEILRGVEDARIVEPITILPQNDQTPMSDESFSGDRKPANRRKQTKSRRKLAASTTATPPKQQKQQNQQQQQQRRTKPTNGRRKNFKKKIQCRDGYGQSFECDLNTYRPGTIRSNATTANRATTTTSKRTLAIQNYSNSDNFKRLNGFTDDTINDYDDDNQQRLSRMIRSSFQQQQQQQHQYQRNATKDPLFPVVPNINHTTASTASQMYREHIDLNPDLCYNVTGLSYGQQKICLLHTHIMPAISRGARAALQECKYQFRSRRWNCSTVDDDTVFGPISGVGSPEMAFVHAMAAAGAASFIARACRDGQLTSCGCSRSSRPKQLHDDWTWGGCGDDLEYGYKFAQSFIDIREKEKKRGTRGLVTVPQKTKLEEKLLSETANESMAITAKEMENTETGGGHGVKSEDLLELQEKITKEILSSKLQEKEMHELQEKINKELLNSKVFNVDHHHQSGIYGGKKKQHRIKVSTSAKARSMMNLHNNEAGRRAVIKKSRITCKCHGVSGSCSLITCWQQLTSLREIGEHLRVKYDEATQVKLNKRGRLQVKDPRYKVPTALDLVYLDESPDWCRINKQLQWQGTHNRVCNKTSAGLDGCAILCCGRGYNTKKIVVRERCNCKFHWCCQVKCETCVKVIEEHSCK